MFPSVLDVTQDARPHASIAWLLGDEEQALQDHILQTLKSHPHEGLAGREVEWSQQVTLSTSPCANR